MRSALRQIGLHAAVLAAPVLIERFIPAIAAALIAAAHELHAPAARRAAERWGK